MKPQMYFNRTQIPLRLDIDLLDKLKRRASNEGISTNLLICELLEVAMKNFK